MEGGLGVLGLGRRMGGKWSWEQINNHRGPDRRARLVRHAAAAGTGEPLTVRRTCNKQ